MLRYDAQVSLHDCPPQSDLDVMIPAVVATKQGRSASNATYQKGVVGPDASGQADVTPMPSPCALVAIESRHVRVTLKVLH